MSKRNEIERERKRALIEQDNRLLLDRLAIAMQTKNIDNVLIEKPFISLMELQRKKELKKIMIANSRLLGRIQSTIPSYDHVLWEKDAEHHVEILKNMTEFPELFVAPGTHKKGKDMAIIDAERAKAKEEARKSGSLHKSRASGDGGGSHSKSGDALEVTTGFEGGTTKQKKGGGVPSPLRTRPGTSSSSFGAFSPQESPVSQSSRVLGGGGSGGSGGSGFVPYSYFPEEQYAQYQRNLLLQQQQLQLQQQQQQQQPPAPELYTYGYAGTQVPMNANTSAQKQQDLFMYHQQQQGGQQYQQQQRRPFQSSQYPSDPYQLQLQQQQQQQQQGNGNYMHYVQEPHFFPPAQQQAPQQPQHHHQYQQPHQQQQYQPDQRGIHLPNIHHPQPSG